MYYIYMMNTLRQNTAIFIVWTWLGIAAITTRILRWCRVRDLYDIKMRLAEQGVFQWDMHTAISQVYKTRLIILAIALAACGTFVGVVIVLAPAWVWLVVIPVAISILAVIGKPAKPATEIIPAPHAFPRISQPVAMSKPGRFDAIDSAAIALHKVKDPVR